MRPALAAILRRLAGPVARFARCTRGISAVEFALAAPILIFMFMATVDFGRFGLANLKMYNAAASLADLGSRDEQLTVAKIDDLFSAADHLAQPFAMADHGRVILSGVSADAPGAAKVFWQRAGAGTLVAASRIGTQGNAASLPPSITVNTGETVIVAETFYSFEPIFGVPLGAAVIYQSAFFRPRLGSLRAIN